MHERDESGAQGRRRRGACVGTPDSGVLPRPSRTDRTASTGVSSSTPGQAKPGQFRATAVRWPKPPVFGVEKAGSTARGKGDQAAICGSSPRQLRHLRVRAAPVGDGGGGDSPAASSQTSHAAVLPNHTRSFGCAGCAAACERARATPAERRQPSLAQLHTPEGAAAVSKPSWSRGKTDIE